MIVSKADLDAIQSHWAVAAISADDRSRAFELAKERLTSCAVGREIGLEFQGEEASDEEKRDDRLLARVALAHEIAVIEGFDALCRSDSENDSSRKQSAAASYKAFDIRRLTKIPKETDERIFHVLKLSALAYCGGRGSDMRQWFEENPSAIEIPSVARASWDRHLLYRLFDCWIRLFRKDGWSDLDRIREIIADLQKNQDVYEEACLARETESDAQTVAFRLVSLYHWARATEIFAEYMLQGKSQTIFDDLDQSFSLGIEAATVSGDMQHEMNLRWLRAVSGVMVADSLWWEVRSVISRVSEFITVPTKNKTQAVLEKKSIESSKMEIAIDMQTSSGRDSLARFHILQSLNQFHSDGGWVAYVTPTREIADYMTSRLRREFESMGLRIKQLNDVMNFDALENNLVRDGDEIFDILVMTIKDFSLTIFNETIVRPLSLVVMDESYDIENEDRDLRIGHLLAAINGNRTKVDFLLLMPYVEKSELLVRWLMRNVDACDSIDLNSTSRNQNEMIFDLYRAISDNSERAGWRFEYETSILTGKNRSLQGVVH